MVRRLDVPLTNSYLDPIKMELQDKKIAAVILAGGINTIPLYDGYEPGYKSLIAFHGRPSIQYVLDAIRGSKYVDSVCIVGSEEAMRDAMNHGDVVFVPPTDSLIQNLVNGIRFFQDREYALVAAADLPLVRTDVIDAFIRACEKTTTEFLENIFIAVVPDSAFRDVFAKMDKAVSRFRDMTVCHGNVMLVQPKFLSNVKAMDRINAMYNARKSAIRSALALGLHLGLTYVIGVHLFHMISMKQMARIASRRFGIGIVPVPIPYPEVAIDVDEPADYRLVSRILNSKYKTSSH